MPGLAPVAKVVRVDIHMIQTGQRAMQIRQFYQYTGTLSTADAQTWLTAIRTAFNTFVSGNLATNLSTTSYELTDLSTTSSPQVVDSTGVTGTAAGTALSAGVAMVIREHILRRYRGGKPRVYIPGMIASSLASSSTWTPAALNSIVAGFTTYTNAATAGTLPVAIGSVTHVNVSYFAGFTNHTYPSNRVKPIPTPRVTPLVDLITSLSGNSIVASQRRRNEQSA